jgi:hypothetical protein
VLDTVTERVVLAVVVVISHITLGLLGGVNRGTSRLYSNLLAVRVAAVDWVNLATRRVGVVLGSEGLLAIAGGLLEVGLGGEVVAFVCVTTDDGTGTLAELTFGDVNLGGSVVGLGTLDCVEVAVVGPWLRFDGTLGWVAVVRKEKVSLSREEKRAEKWGNGCRSDNNKTDWVRQELASASASDQGAVGGWRLGCEVNKKKSDLPVSGVAVLVDVNLYAFGATGLGRLGLSVAVLLLLLLLGAALAIFEDTDVLGVGLAAFNGSLSRLVDVD